MSDPLSDGELHLLVEELEAQIESLREIAQGCRKWILLSKLAMGGAGAWLMAIGGGLMRLDPTMMLLAIAAMLGGIVLAGSNASTLHRTEAAIKAAEALRARAIDAADLPAVEIGSTPRQIH
jgi:hypothetical protein